MPVPARLHITQLASAIMSSAGGWPRAMVGIDGPGAAGKSTLAEQLAECIERSAIVHVDDFYLPTVLRESRRSESGARFDLPRLARQVIIPAIRGEAFRYQRYDWPTDLLAEWIPVPADAAVIVEGVYCLELGLRRFYTYTVFCRCDPTIRLHRGLDRDGVEAEARWTTEWMPAEERYVDSERPDEFADLVIDSSRASEGGPARFDIQRWNKDRTA